MVAIHVSWYKNKFYIWAESTDYIEDAAESTLFHPYLFDQDDLLLWLEGILGSEIEEERLTILTGIFPCNSGIPEVSPMLEQFADNTQEINSSEVANITMNSFKVHCYELSIQEYTDLFKQTLESQDLGYEINASSDTLFWSYIYQWMLKAIANKILCPMIEKNENRLNSYWRLPITGLDRDTLKQLADYLPLSAHCLGLTLEEIKNQFPTSVIYESMQFLANNWILLREKKSKSKAKELPKMIEKYIGDEWLKTLDNAEISINYPSEITPKIDFFIEKLNTWQLKLKYEDDILLKVLFKFHYPEEESDEWLIEYTIQSYLDKDICLPLSYVLQNMNRSADYFNIPIEKFSQTLCFLLGHTNHTLPKFTLEFTPEKAYTNIISTEKVYSLWEQTNLLQDNKLVDFTFPFNRGDFESFDITARVNSFSDTNHYFSINRLVSFDWKLSIGDNTLTKKELDALVKSKIPLVQVNGQWKILNRSSLQPIIRKMNKYKKKLL